MAERQPRFGRVADGRRNARIRHRHHQVGIRRAFPRQPPPQIFPRFFHRAPEDNRIRPREVNVLKHTLGALLLRRIALARHPFRADFHHFARFHVVQVDGADQVEGAGFGGEHVAFAAAGDFHFAHRERAEAVRIARHQDAILRQQHQRESAFHLQQRLAQRASQRALRRVRHQVQHQLGIARSLEHRAQPAQFLAQLRRVGDVAIVGNRQPPLVARNRKRLRVQQDGVAGRGIARVADGQFARQRGQHRFGEDIRHVPHLFARVDAAAVGGANAGRFLPPVLQGVQPQVGHLGGFGMAIDGDHTTFFMKFIGHGNGAAPPGAAAAV